MSKQRVRGLLNNWLVSGLEPAEQLSDEKLNKRINRQGSRVMVEGLIELAAIVDGGTVALIGISHNVQSPNAAIFGFSSAVLGAVYGAVVTRRADNEVTHAQDVATMRANQAEQTWRQQSVTKANLSALAILSTINPALELNGGA